MTDPDFAPDLSDPDAFHRLTAAGFRARVRAALSDHPPARYGDFTFNPEFRDFVLERAVRPAAVLVPVVNRPDELSVILTKRTEALTAHSGQIAFPGGKIDAADPSAEAAALREAEEEIGLRREQVEIVGRMPDYHTGSGYIIAPVIGLVDPGAALAANPEEVDYYFEVPLAFLMNRQNHRRGAKMFQGKTRYFLEMPFGEHYIWGVTAGIIRVMHDILTGDIPPGENGGERG